MLTASTARPALLSGRDAAKRSHQGATVRDLGRRHGGRVQDYTTRLFAADFDPALVRTTQMNILMASDARARVFHMNSLEFPGGNLGGVGPARECARLRSIPSLDSEHLRHGDAPHATPSQDHR